MERERVWAAIEVERRALADVLDALTPEQWEAPSLCPGWRVREVAAHVTLAARARPLNAGVGLLRARGSFNRYVADDARARSARTPAQLVDDLRQLAGVRRGPPGTSPEDPLVDILVHTQDIALPLGFAPEMPPDAAIAAADRVWAFAFPFFARRRAAGLHLSATDGSWQRGHGDEVVGPLSAILLVLTGRSAGLERLEGPGVPTLASRVSSHVQHFDGSLPG